MRAPGPSAVFSLSCDGCEYLIRDGAAFGCREPSVVDANDGPRVVGIGNSDTPVYCPFRVAEIERAVADGITRREAGRLAELLHAYATGAKP